MEPSHDYMAPEHGRRNPDSFAIVVNRDGADGSWRGDERPIELEVQCGMACVVVMLGIARRITRSAGSPVGPSRPTRPSQPTKVSDQLRKGLREGTVKLPEQPLTAAARSL
jgi:hypothetical protein